MKHRNEPQSRARALGAIGVTCAVVLGLGGAYFGSMGKAADVQRAPQPRQTRSAEPASPAAQNEAALDPGEVLAAAPMPDSSSKQPPAAASAVDQTAQVTLPPPPQLPEPTSNPSPETEQDPAWKADRTKAIRRVVTGRADRLARDLAERERVGDAAGAAQLRVVSARLEKQLRTIDGELDELASVGAGEPR